MSSSYFFDNNVETSFLQEIKRSLKECDGFDWTVSFIKKAGLILLADDIEQALSRGVKGRILTSTYQNFTDIGSLEIFLRWQENYPDNFECHLEDGTFKEPNKAEVPGFHTKGYIFHYADKEKIIIGSSNITRFALLYNKEWDLAVVDTKEAPIYIQVQKEFDYLWNKTELRLSRQDVVAYSSRLQYAVSSWDMDGYVLDRLGKYKPNAMQRKALDEIRRQRRMNVDRVLIVAATGSGKTFLSAFDAMEAEAKRLLFIVHKDMILENAMETYMHVFSNTRTYGMFAGGKKEIDRDFIFATNVSVAQNLELFDPNEFDYIVIDEVHHAVASTYKKIIDYFKPAFLLGMTATPDRMDEGDVYGLFGNNVPYDLRLRDAIENELVVPFHYFGIKDQYLDYDEKAIAGSASKLVQGLIADKHVDFLLDNVDSHRPIGMGKLKCVGFCRTVEHARMLSEVLNSKGRQSLYLSGKNSLQERTSAFKRLQDEKDPVEFVFAVDILNEGIDVPAMNMVLFLRPTESSTIFLQQLGRGLRKYDGKPYLTVLDFIGNNYTRAAQIALAFGTLTKTGAVDQRTITDLVSKPKDVIDIPGLEIIFDVKSSEEILKSVQEVNFNAKRFLVSDYKNYKKYLVDNGEITDNQFPKCMHYLDAEVPMDLMRFVVSDFKSYYDFLSYADSEVAPIFDDEEKKILATLTFFLPLVRSEEFDILRLLLEKPMNEATIQDALQYNPNYSPEAIRHALLVLQGVGSIPGGAFFIPLIKKDGNGIYSWFKPIGEGPLLDAINDVLEYGLVRYTSDFYARKSDLMRFGFYTGAKALLALSNYKLEDSNTPSLYYESGVQPTSKGLCLFINLEKPANAEERLKYKDKFLSRDILQWESQTGTTLTNTKGQNLIARGKAHIFVRKSKKKGDPFVYLGVGRLTDPKTSDNPGKTLIFKILLEQPIPEEYDYDVGYKEID